MSPFGNSRPEINRIPSACLHLRNILHLKNIVKNIVKNVVKNILKNIIKNIVKDIVKNTVKNVVKNIEYSRCSKA